MQVDSLATQYTQIKAQIKHLEDQLAAIKLDLNQHLEENNKSKVVTSSFIIEKRPMQMEHIHKQDIPDSLWKQYAKRQTHMCLYVRKVPPPQRANASTRQRSHRKSSRI